MWLHCRRRSKGTGVCWVNGSSMSLLTASKAWFTLMKQTGKRSYAHCKVFSHFCKWDRGCVKIFIRLSCMCHLQAKTDTVQQDAWLVMVWGWRPRSNVPCAAHLPLAVILFLNSLAVQHANNRDRFKPHCSFRTPAHAISTLMVCLAAVGLSELGTNVFVCVGK